jgi:LysM repeat protein
LAFLARLLFDNLLVPIYRAYLFFTKKITDSSQMSSTRGKLFDLLMNRLVIHVLIILFGGLLIYNNLSQKQNAISSDELVGKTKLAAIISEGSQDSEQLIEDYPNLNIANLQRHFKYGETSLRVNTNIFSQEQLTPNEVNQNMARTETTVYTVQNGDTISSIARRWHVSINTILWENNLKVTSLIKPGTELTILPTSGVSHTVARGQTLGAIAKLYGVSTDDILKINGLKNVNQIRIGEKLIIPGGTQLAQNNNQGAPAKISNIASSLKNIISRGSNSSLVSPSGRMIWPTVGHTITQYFSYVHTGVDIANHIGTPIYAADNGVVITAGYNRGGYGNMILIDHGGGKTTRYGHLSAFGVTVGQRVTKGQYIGAMGSTGHSTGPHLHFEVMINGKHYNPLNYVR